MAGSLVYITSFYVSVLCAEQEMYFNMAIYLPLMLLAIDKGMRERTYGLLIATVFLAIISSYYFFYMITILSAVYAVFRYWHNAPRIRKAPQTFLSGTLGTALFGGHRSVGSCVSAAAACFSKQCQNGYAGTIHFL